MQRFNTSLLEVINCFILQPSAFFGEHFFGGKRGASLYILERANNMDAAMKMSEDFCRFADEWQWIYDVLLGDRDQVDKQPKLLCYIIIVFQVHQNNELQPCP